MGLGLSIDLVGVSVRYAGRPALREVTLSIEPGELLALTGPNGSGKTTLLKSILGLVAVESGTIRVGGSELAGLAQREKARGIAWVPQSESPLDNVPLIEYVLYGRHPHIGLFERENAEDARRVSDALAAVDLTGREEVGILELSGGERQRALLARALAQDTPVLLLDEPTSSLDIGHQLDLLERIRARARGEGRTVVTAMHDLNLAARYADRIAVLDRGRLVALGPPAEVLSATLLREVWGVTADLRHDARTGLPFLVPRLPPPAPTEERPSSGRRRPVHVIGGGGAAVATMQRLVDEGYRVTAGVLNLLDSDSETAQLLGIPFAAEVPFAPLGEEARAENRRLMGEADAIVLTPFAVGPSNLANLEDVVTQSPTGPPVFVFVEPPWSARDFSHGRAAPLAEVLLARGATPVKDVGSLLRALGGLPRRAPTTPVHGGPATATG
ncbi:MAG: ATP-binding cassette domain-containing protein [Thermoplasmata archaeon]|nr:ATP-binding cassette domain-containing protein [Thermoplasmata archaeon]